MSIYLALYLLLIHWVADFLCQTRELATTKWESHKSLLKHTTIYSVVFCFFLIFLLNLTIYQIVLFGLITFAVHTTQDFFTSKLTHRQFLRNETNGWNGGFTIIGFDQWLHFVQIFLTFHYLTR